MNRRQAEEASIYSDLGELSLAVVVLLTLKYLEVLFWFADQQELLLSSLLGLLIIS